jgi:hypothetical protein
MKKSMVSMFVLLAFVGFMGVVYARPGVAAPAPKPKYEIVIVEVVSIDMAKNTFVGKVVKTQAERTFSAGAPIIAKLKVKEEVKLFLTPGTDMVMKIRVVVKRPLPLKAK